MDFIYTGKIWTLSHHHSNHKCFAQHNIARQWLLNMQIQNATLCTVLFPFLFFSFFFFFFGSIFYFVQKRCIKISTLGTMQGLRGDSLQELTSLALQRSNTGKQNCEESTRRTCAIFRSDISLHSSLGTRATCVRSSPRHQQDTNLNPLQRTLLSSAIELSGPCVLQKWL